MIYLIGWAFLPSIIILFLNSFFFGKVSLKIKSFQKKYQDSKAVRLSLTSEFLTNIKSSKLYSWNEFMLKKIDESRNEELKI